MGWDALPAHPDVALPLAALTAVQLLRSILHLEDGQRLEPWWPEEHLQYTLAATVYINRYVH